MIPPQPNSTSSGCAPIASSESASVVGFIRAVDGITIDEVNLRRVLLPQVCLFACAGDVVRAPDNLLHPPQPRVARRGDLLLGEFHRRERHIALTAFMQAQ